MPTNKNRFLLNFYANQWIHFTCVHAKRLCVSYKWPFIVAISCDSRFNTICSIFEMDFALSELHKQRHESNTKMKAEESASDSG